MEKSYYFSKNELVLLLGTGNVTDLWISDAVGE